MKKIAAIVLAVLIMTGCRQKVPSEYEYYAGFEKAAAQQIVPVDTAGYTDTAKEENLPLLREKAGLENLTGHSLYEKKKAVVLNLYFDSYAGHSRIDRARQYGYETFWLGKLHTADMLPYEDWQYSHWIKDFRLQIYSGDQLVLQDVYTFDRLTDSGEKLYKLETKENTDVVLNGTYIWLGDWLKGTQDQLDAYVNIDSVAGQTVHTSMRQSLCRDRLFVQLLTEENQIDPNRLNDILAAVQERYSFINENITVQLYVADKGMYFEYSAPVTLPAEE